MDFHKDNVIKLEYNPVLDATLTYGNAVGATDSLTLRFLGFTPTDTNTLFVSKTGSDTTGDGTQSNPYLTIVKAASMVTASKQNVVILDSGEYIEVSHAFDTNCKNIAAALGQKPTIKPELVPASSNYLIETIKGTTAIKDLSTSTSGQAYSAALSNGDFAVLYSDVNSVVCFQIIDKNGNIIKGETLVTDTTGTIYEGGICALNSGYFVVTFGGPWGSGGSYYWVYRNDGILYSTGAVPDDDNRWRVYPFGGNNEAFILVHGTRSYYQVLTIDGGVVISYRQIYSENSVSKCVPVNSGGFIWFSDGSLTTSGVWIAVDSSGNILHTETYSQYKRMGCIVYNNKLIVATKHNPSYLSDSLFFLAEYNLSDYSLVRDFTEISGISASSITDMTLCQQGVFAVAINYDPVIVYFFNYDNWAILKSETFSTAHLFFSLSYNYYIDRLLIAYVLYGGPVAVYINIKGGFITDWLTALSDITFNGIIFDNEVDYIRRYLYSSSGVFKLKWCDFENIIRVDYKDADTYPLYIATVVGSFECSNCRIFNNDGGFKITGTSVEVKYNQFFKQLLNSAVYIIGAGSGIIINHNDFLYNYICVKLQGNNGSEVIKNNIFFYSLLFSIYAQTAITYTHCVDTAESYNATPGTMVIRSQPHYINDGYLDEDDINLVLKQRELGYSIDSPAIGIADDLSNAGSVISSLSGVTYTWTEITVQKDLSGGIERYYEPVGAIETILSDGTVKASRESFVEVLVLKWRALLNEDYDKLFPLASTNDCEVRVYLDPLSDPAVYGTYTHVYDKFNGFTKMPKLSRTGKEDFSLTFKRPYNEGS